ncbi:hypothetical protein AB4Z52_13590 [Rhizobium sp. 2YAF20]|uniref:hypothetical protein n=1 Tax=Rhizobium sp. 2YAF20 TaxID=3233027 RepID=UPI003F955CF3
MKVPAKQKLSAHERNLLALKKSFEHYFANIDKHIELQQARVAEVRAKQADALTRRAIERQCRRKYFRDKYAKMGLWPLPPVGTLLKI